MPKLTLKDYRDEYKRVTGKNAAVRWQKKDIEREIAKFKAVQSVENNSRTDQITGEKNPEFERLIQNKPFDDRVESSEQSSTVNEDEFKTENRGGPREGAGRPSGQTDRRARAESVMKLDVPDLGVAMAVDAFNTGLQRVTGIGIDEKSVTGDVIGEMPHGSESLALGLTKILYFWFPGLQGRTDILTLHLEALFLMINPFRERALKQLLILKQKEQQSNEQSTEENKVVTAVQSGPARTKPKSRTGKKPKGIVKGTTKYRAGKAV